MEESTMAENKKLDKIRLGLLNQFGANAIIKGADMEKANYGRIPTGSLSLDLDIGGGIPVGRMIQIAGNKSTSKSSLCDHIIRNAQNLTIEWTHVERKAEKGREIVNEHKRTEEGLICGYLDVEGTKTPEWTQEVLGVDMDNWIYTQPGGLEEAFDMAIEMQKSGVHLIVIDSIDSLEPTKHYDTDFADSVQMGIKPKIIGEYCRKYTATNNKLVREGKLPCTVILINQIREKIGGYGNPEYTPGGKAIEFYISLDLRLRRGDWIKVGKGEDAHIVGQTVKYKTEKNKTYKQQQNGEYDFYFESCEGHDAGSIDVFKEIVIQGYLYGVLERAGAWYRYNGENLANGMDNTILFLKENPEKFESIKTDLFKIINGEVDQLTGGIL